MELAARSVFLVLLLGVYSFAPSYAFQSLAELLQFLTSPFYYRIVGGQEANIEDYPHQVSFMANNSFFCGGFIVAENFILTAAHCARNVDPNTVVLRAGSSFREDGKIIPIAEVTIHPEYDNSRFDKDVAVMKTVEPIQFTETIQPIALPLLGRPMVADSTINVSGWGKTDQDAGNIPERLMEVTIPVVHWMKCMMPYPGTFSSNQFCAGNFMNGGQGTCQGDSGGTAVQDEMAVGIVSYGRGCGLAGSPSVFADIAAPSIRSFINQHTNL